ncbi:MAG: anti-sigma factor [Verrucomicrobia bacterium]|nr:anti-sigma factor [Verrucomicrobiota bacterium]
MLDPEKQEQTALFLLAELGPEARQAYEALREADPAVAAYAVEANARLERIMQGLEPGVHRASETVRQALFAAVASSLVVPSTTPTPAPAPTEPLPAARPPAPAPALKPEGGIIAAALAGQGGWGFAAVIGALVLVAAGAGWATPLLQSRAVVAADNSHLRTELHSAQSTVTSLQNGLTEAIRASQNENLRVIGELTARKSSLEKERDTLRQNLENTTAELLALQGGDHLSRLQIQVLRPAVAGDDEPGQPLRGLFVWDPSKQVGLIALQNLPPLPPDQDCQVWALDPSMPQPVSLGLASAKRPANLRAPQRLARLGEIRVTIEKKGGASSPEGPTLLVSDK